MLTISGDRVHGRLTALFVAMCISTSDTVLSALCCLALISER